MGGVHRQAAEHLPRLSLPGKVTGWYGHSRGEIVERQALLRRGDPQDEAGGAGEP